MRGIGLDSNEFNNPPSKFQPLFIRARKDGLMLTCHCDVTQPETLSNITCVLNDLGSEDGEEERRGADRIDHGLDAGSSLSLVSSIASKGTLMTLCPWAYVRHHTEKNLSTYLRNLKDAGVKINISSDSPAYVERNYMMENLRLLENMGGWKEEDFVTMCKDSIEGCWAEDDVKRKLRREIDEVWEKRQKTDVPIA
jgi:adenosine deaminase